MRGPVPSAEELREMASRTACGCGCGAPVKAWQLGTVLWRGVPWAEACYYRARGTTGVVDDILKTLADKPLDDRPGADEGWGDVEVIG